MMWKERYIGVKLDTVNGIDIFKDRYYVINQSTNSLEKLKVNDGWVVKINNIVRNKEGVYFNNRTLHGDSYSWHTVYADYIVRMATFDEANKLKHILMLDSKCESDGLL